MSTAFDPYQQWLGIAPEEQPVTHYRLLGLKAGASDRDAIQAAADQAIRKVNMYRRSAHAKRCDEVIHRIHVARACLLNPSHKTQYDRQLKIAPEASVAAAESPAVAAPSLEPSTTAAQNAAPSTTAAQKAAPTAVAARKAAPSVAPAQGAASPGAAPAVATPSSSGPSTGAASHASPIPASGLEAGALPATATKSNPPSAPTNESEELSFLFDEELDGAAAQPSAPDPSGAPRDAGGDEEKVSALAGDLFAELGELSPDPATSNPWDAFDVGGGQEALETPPEPALAEPDVGATDEATSAAAPLPFACGYKVLSPEEEVPVVAPDLGYDVLPDAAAEPLAAARRKGGRSYLVIGGVAVLAVLVLVGAIGFTLGPAVFATWSAPTMLRPFGVGRRAPPRPSKTTAKAVETPAEVAAPAEPPLTTAAVAAGSLSALRTEAATLLDLSDEEITADQKARLPVVASGILLWSQRTADRADRAPAMRQAAMAAARAGDIDLARRCLDAAALTRRWDEEHRLWLIARKAVDRPAARRALLAVGERLLLQALREDRLDRAGQFVEEATNWSATMRPAVAASRGPSGSQSSGGLVAGISPATEPATPADPTASSSAMAAPDDESSTARDVRAAVDGWKTLLDEAKAAALVYGSAEAQSTSAPAGESTSAPSALALDACLFRWDWAKGLPLLAASREAPWRAIGIAETKDPTTAAEQGALADLWWEQAQQATGEAAGAMLARASVWYDRALDGTDDTAARQRFTERLNAIAALPPRIVDPQKIGDMWWRLAEQAEGPRRAALRQRADYWYGQIFPEYADEGAVRERAERATESAAAEQTPAERSPWREELLGPVAFAEPGTSDAALARFYISLGQYGGQARGDEQGLQLIGMRSTTALWLPEPVEERFDLSVNVERLGATASLVVWLGGPGYGQARAGGYCLRWDGTKIELFREGVVATSAEAPRALGGQAALVHCARHGDRFVCEIDGQRVIDWQDPKALAGPLYGHVGIGCNRGESEAGLRIRQIELRRPLLVIADRAALVFPWLATPPTVLAATEAEPVWALAGRQMLESGWFLSQPEAISPLDDGRLLLSGPAALPTVVCREPFLGDFALEAEFEYVPPRHPRPAWIADAPYATNFLASGGEDSNFRLLIVLSKEFPEPDRFATYQANLAAGWEIALPGNDGMCTLSWLDGMRREVLASSADHAPPAGVRHVVRIERVRGRIRVLLNAGLLFETDRPLEPELARLPAFVGIRQNFGGALVRRAGFWKLGAPPAGR